MGDKKTLSFNKPGMYAYICAFHPFMKATVVVT
jgi:plastocyanin